MVDSAAQRKLLLAIADQEMQESLRLLGFTRRNKKAPFVAALGANSEVLVFPQIHSRNTFPRLNPVVAVENHLLRSELGNLFPQTSYPRFADFYLHVVCGRFEDWRFSTEGEAKAAAQSVADALQSHAWPLVEQWKTDGAAKALVAARVKMRGPAGVIVTPWPSFPPRPESSAASEA